MLLVAPVRLERCFEQPMEGEDLTEIVSRMRSDVPAVTHVDFSARVQTVTAADHAFFYDVLKAFEKRTGCGLLVNTSFNVRGEPIVCSPSDAYRCFMRTGMDMLVIEDCVLQKSAQPEWHEPGDWRTEHELD